MITLYGAGPIPDISPRIPEMEGPYVIPPEGDTAVLLKARIEARVKWLENQLRMHEAWKEELQILQRMLKAGK